MVNINTPIERLDLSVRAYSILKRAGKNTVGEVLSDLGSIKNLRNMTRTVYGEIYDATIQFALSQTTFEKSASRVENETEERKRITFEGNFCEIARCLETPGGSFCEDGYCSQRRVWERLKEYEDLEDVGLIMRLPCKLGGKCYDILEGEVYENNSDYIGISLDKAKGEIWFTIDDMEVRPKDFGKIFGTKEEAEAALRKENLLEEDPDAV